MVNGGFLLATGLNLNSCWRKKDTKNDVLMHIFVHSEVWCLPAEWTKSYTIPAGSLNLVIKQKMMSVMSSSDFMEGVLDNN